MISLECLVVPENKKVLKQKTKKPNHTDEGMSEGHRSQPGEAPNGQRWNSFSNKIINLVLEYNPSIK